jgi:ferredoxin
MAPAENTQQALFVSGPLKQTGRIMVKDENVCLHCGLCAERCPTFAWDMRKFVLELPNAETTFIPLEAVRRVTG